MILNAQQKFFLWLLSFFSVFIIWMWAAQFNQSIGNSLKPKTVSKQNIPTVPALNLESANNNESDMKTKDTDADGLNDWDEIYVYKTSPYIADSDSDGYLDGYEIQAKTDPNCPHGQDCGAAIYQNATEQQSPTIVPEVNLGQLGANQIPGIDLNNIDPQTLQLLQQASGQAPSINPVDISGFANADLQNILSGKSDAATLRGMLRSAGIDANMLNQLSDEDLMQAYQETLAQ